MQEIIKKTQFQYLDCNQGGLHEGECLNLICVDKKCQNQKLLCSVCIQDNHKDHQKNIIPLKKFLALVSSKIDQNTQNNFNSDQILENLQQVLQGNLFQLKELVQNISDQIRQIEKNILASYEIIKKRIMSQSHMSENMPKVIDSLLTGEFSNVDILQENCQALVDSVNYIENDIKLDFNPNGIFKNYENTSNTIQKDMRTFTEQYNNSFQQINKLLENTKENFVESGTQIVDVPTFSETLKSKTIALSSDKHTATQNSEGEKRYALASTPISKVQVQYIGFKINKMAGWVGVGIGIEEVLKSKDFGFSSYSTCGHGAWLISSNNYIWSNSNLEENQKSTSFPFKTDDIILMKYDPEKQILSFKKKQNGGQVVQLKVNLNSYNGQIYPCANLCQKNDSVTFIKMDPADQF